MILESYSIRGNFFRFGEEIETCKYVLDNRVRRTKTFNRSTYETLTLLVEGINHLAQMCKKQSINVLGFGETKVSPFRDLSASANQLNTLRSLYLEKSDDSNFDVQKALSLSLLEKLYAAVQSKLSRASLQETEENISPIIPEQTDSGSFKSLPEAMTVLKEEPIKEDQFGYDKLNILLDQERNALQSSLDEGELLKGFIEFKGSVAVNHFFKARDLKTINYSMFSFKGVEFSFNRRETIPPMFVFHDQTLVAFDLKRKKFKFSKQTDYKSPQMIMDERKQQITKHFENCNFINLTQYTEAGYLYSKAFKDLYFLWFVTPKIYQALGQFPEGKTNLMWRNE